MTELAQFFEEDLIFSAYDINVWKPDPALFLHAAKIMGVQPSRCVIIEDSLAGIDAGLAAGMQTLGYASSFESQTTDLVPFVYHLDELVQFLA